MELLSFIIHRVDKIQHQTGVANTYPRESTISPQDQLAIELVSEILKRYEFDKYHAHAKFGAGSTFADEVRALIEVNNNGTPEDYNAAFYQLSIQLLNNLAAELRKDRASPATGGYLGLSHYRLDNNNFFIVILIKENENISINNELNITKIKSLNLESIHFAAKININDWLHDIENVSPDNRYLVFLKGKSRINVVEYFKDLIGIDTTTFIDPIESTNKLIEAIKSYCQTHTDDINKEIVYQNVHAAMLNAINNNETISLARIAEIVIESDEQTHENAFITYIRQQNITLSDEFKPSKSIIKNLIEYRYKTSTYSITMKNEGLNRDFHPDRDTHSITFTGISDDILNQLLGEEENEGDGE